MVKPFRRAVDCFISKRSSPEIPTTTSRPPKQAISAPSSTDLSPHAASMTTFTPRPAVSDAIRLTHFHFLMFDRHSPVILGTPQAPGQLVRDKNRIGAGNLQHLQDE